MSLYSLVSLVFDFGIACITALESVRITVLLNLLDLHVMFSKVHFIDSISPSKFVDTGPDIVVK